VKNPSGTWLSIRPDHDRVTGAPTAADQVAQQLYGHEVGRISQYVDILATRGVAYGLLGPKEASRIWERHILNSAALSQLIEPGNTVIDVGSGAGLPGIPLTLLRPDLRVTLLEPLLRRFTFLVEALSELRLSGRVEVVRARAEEHRGRYDVVVARAVAPLDRLIGWCDPLRRPEGVLLALKGQNAGAEIDQAAQVLARHRLVAELITAQADPRADSAFVVRITDSVIRPRA
jgi:16S rRNA (guanine527-N7)-methyltransferase